jgi:hypothetical protein
MLALVRGQALKRKTTSHDLKIDLQDILPNEILTRCGLPVDLPTTVAPKNWGRRGYNQCVPDNQPASSEWVASWEKIINAGKRRRGEID